MSDTTPPGNGSSDSNTPPYGGYSGYGGPPPGPGYGGGYGAGGPGGQPPPNHLAWAIITTILCCLPLGVVSIVFAAQVNGKWSSGDIAGAQDASKKARTFALWGTIIGVVWAVLLVVLFLGGMMSMNDFSGGGGGGGGGFDY